MKQTFLILFAAISLIACNNSGDTASQTADTTKMNDTKMASSTTTADLPYQVKDWADWQPGSMENLKTAMQSLKDYVDGNIDACVTGFADSAEVRFDYLIAKLPKDSLAAMFKRSRADSKSIQINMDDYESVKSKNGKEEWVTLWYKQKWQDNKGKWDSAAIVDDLKMVNGKIAVLDETRRFFPKKKM